MRSLLLVLIPVCLIAMAVSCKKNNAPNAGGSTLDKIILTYSGSTAADTAWYKYDPQNRLISVTQTQGPNNGSFSYSFSYDPGGKLSGYAQSNTAIGSVDSYAFQYDNNGRIIKSTGTPLEANLQVDDFAYSYDGQGRLAADTQLFQQNHAIITYHTYVYDANNDIIKEDQFEKVNGSLQLTWESTSVFDNKANPFAAIRIPLFMMFNDPSMLSANNTVHRQSNNLTTPSAVGNTDISSYAYYSNGLIWRRVGSNPATTNTSTQEYHYKAP
jgi:YD repeat-containing protein